MSTATRSRGKLRATISGRTLRIAQLADGLPAPTVKPQGHGYRYTYELTEAQWARLVDCIERVMCRESMGDLAARARARILQTDLDRLYVENEL